MPVNVLLVDDSAVVRGLMSKALAADMHIRIAGSAANGSLAIALAEQTQPDVIVLDIEMPVMDGLTALPELLRVSPKSKVIMASTLTVSNAEISMKALELGATDYLAKPSTSTGNDGAAFYRELISKIRVLGGLSPVSADSFKPLNGVASLQKPATANTALVAMQLNQSGIKAVAIASSTGGPQALLSFFGQLKGRLQHVPIFITQHMPPAFTTILADHISKAGERPCSEAKEGMAVKPGHCYVAPGDFHMIPEKTVVGEIVLRIKQGPPENFCRPAADPMFRALSDIYGKHLLGVVMTGMGQDGMEGSKAIIAKGGNVIAQDEASSTVYGMPKAIVEHNLARAVLPLNGIAEFLIQAVERRA